MDRRSFIKLTAITGTSAALASCGNPENQLIRFVPDEDIVPGVATFKPGVCTLCASGCGLTVRVMAADAEVVRNGQAGVVQIYAAKKLEGNAGHPVNQGALCARGQAAIQAAYHPDRITQPLRRTGERGTGQYEAISWDDALAEIVERLDAVEGGGGERPIAFLGRTGSGHRAMLVERFLQGLGAPGALVPDVFGDDVLRRANGLSFGREQLPTFDLANARYVIGFGADFLGTWNSPVAHALAYGRMRQGRPGIRGAFVQVESRMSQTGANADEWVPVRPGTEGVLALGLAQVIMAANLRPAGAAGRAGSVVDGWAEGLGSYAPEQVEAITGVAAARIERLARELAERGPAVAIVGGAPLAHTNGLFTAVAVNALNALLGAVEQPGGVHFMPRVAISTAAPSAGGRPTFRLRSDGDGGPYIADARVLLLDGANPVYTFPPAWKVADAIGQVPFIASFGSFLDETSALADLILPDHSFLESWSDAIPESGALVPVVTAAPPVMAPLHQTRSMPDVLIEIASRLATPVELPWASFEEMLGATFADLPTMTEGLDAWSDAQEKGGWWELPAPSGGGSAPEAAAGAEGAVGAPPGSAPRAPGTTGAGTGPGTPAGTGAVPVVYSEPGFDGDAEQFPFHFLPYPSSAFLDGSLAHLPWLQEMPDPLTSAMWSSWVEINPTTAARLGIAQGDVVEIASTQGTLRSAAMITPGIAPDMVAMPVGQGHRMFTRYATGRGENPMEIVAPLSEPATGALAWAGTRVRIARAGDPDGRLILFAGGLREHEDHGR